MEITSVEEFEQWLSDPDNFQIAKPSYDRYAGKAIATHDLKHAAGAEDTEALRREITELKIAKALGESAAEHGIDVGLLESLNLRFEDEAEVAPRIADLAAAIDERTIAGVNERLRASFKPGSGNERPARDFTSMSREELILCESLGELNALLSE